MSIARYLSKLGATLGSDGKVPATGIADDAVTTVKLAGASVTAAKLAAGAARANFGSGAVLQVVQAMTNGDQTFAPNGSNPPGATWQSVSGVSASITPSSTSSKILVSCFFKCCGLVGNSPNNPYWGGRITYSIAGGGYSVVPPVGAVKTGNAQAHFNISPDRADGSQYRMTSANGIQLLHSPATTSTLNYRLEVAGFLANLRFGSPGDPADDDYWTEPYGITLMEIAG